MKLNKFIDHTLLKPTATSEDIIKLCEEAKTYNFKAVCVNSCFMKLAKETLENSDVKVCTVIGFPLGTNATQTKVFEAKEAIKNGADEIDMVINIGFLRDKLYDLVLEDIKAVKAVSQNTILKVIIETCYLTETEILKATEIVNQSEANFIKTSTGFGSRGASLEDIKLIKSVPKSELHIKASGGIRDYKTALEYINLGVNRIGTSSGVKIVTSTNK